MVIVEVMFSRAGAGLERASLDYATMLSGRGNQVHFILPHDAALLGELRRLQEATDGKVVPHPIPISGWSRLLLRFRLSRLFRSLAPDVIVTLGAKAISRVAPARPRAVPLVASTQNAGPRLMKATHLIALTESIRELFIGRGFPAGRIRKVPNAVPARFTRIPRRDDGLHSPIVFGVMARLIHKKGVDVFLRGFKLALDAGLRARAVIGGDGPLRPELEALASSLGLDGKVSFTGWVSNATEFFDSIDVFCVPSRDEPFGIVVLEGFAHGTPVIAAAVGGPREMIQDGVNGSLFESDNPADLAAKLPTLADPQTLGSMREAAYAQLPQYYGEAVGERLEAALQAAIDDMRKSSGSA